VTNVELVVEFEGNFLEETANLSMELKSSRDDWLGLLLDVRLEFFEVADLLTFFELNTVFEVLKEVIEDRSFGWPPDRLELVFEE
jgi:hypothetical protein